MQSPLILCQKVVYLLRGKTEHLKSINIFKTLFNIYFLVLIGCHPINSNLVATPDQEYSPSTNTSSREGFLDFDGLPIPNRSVFDLDRTLVLGSQQNWTGRIVIISKESVETLYDFYLRAMLLSGWINMSVIRSSSSVLIFKHDARVVTITISSINSVASGSVIEFLMVSNTAHSN